MLINLQEYKYNLKTVLKNIVKKRMINIYNNIMIMFWNKLSLKCQLFIKKYHKHHKHQYQHHKYNNINNNNKIYNNNTQNNNLRVLTILNVNLNHHILSLHHRLLTSTCLLHHKILNLIPIYSPTLPYS